MDDFTLGLLSNDEVLAVDQDALGKEARRISQEGTSEVWAKPLADGTWAAGLFNRGESPASVTLKFEALKLPANELLRDLWRQKDLGEFKGEFTATIAPDGVVMVRIAVPAKGN
jgi:alpha-galactosidase